jgi:transposase
MDRCPDCGTDPGAPFQIDSKIVEEIPKPQPIIVTEYKLTRRAADAVRSEYDAILSKIRSSPILYVDETSIRVQGERHWIGTFTTPTESFFVIRKSRGMKVLMEVLTRRFKGIIVSIPLHNALKELYEILTEALEIDPPPEVRKTLWQLAREALRHWIMKEYSIEKVRKLIGKINNGFDYRFTFVINLGVEPTNNRAERALRPNVVLRKILGTLRDEKGTSIHERIMTTLATWGQNGLKLSPNEPLS